ncbi:hypothetical protein LUZ61_015556 [Rhynchospora tenuis]|uniref:DDE Tnp4 domain-containing protein n=1 Tax=Rhynchospora tenuis TaxID=198213 RepID=A0AAD5Z3U2_9POAL|nr:hypothetical protein LUZ61_015556 [Rhynchospora tenuis]
MTSLFAQDLFLFISFLLPLLSIADSLRSEIGYTSTEGISPFNYFLQYESIHRVIMLEATYFQQPDGSQIPVEISSASKLFPFFKDCIGAIDGTHVRAKVSTKDAPRFHGRKEYPTQNILSACGFDLKFTYVLAGWEGTTSDSKIIKNALSRSNRLIIPEGYEMMMYMIESCACGIKSDSTLF